MKRIPYIALAIGLLSWGVLASAQVSRYIVETNDGGVYTEAAFPALVRGQSSFTAVATICAANACTRTAPSGATEGLPISGVGSYIVTASLSSGTFSGSGPIEIYAYLNEGSTGPTAGWYYILGADITPPSGKSSFVTMVNTVSLRPGNYRLAVRPNAVATSVAAPVLTLSVRACQTATCAP